MVIEQNNRIENIDAQNDVQDLLRDIESWFLDENAETVWEKLNEQNRDWMLQQWLEEYSELTTIQRQNISALEIRWIRLDKIAINKIKDINLNSYELQIIDIIQNELWIKLYWDDLETVRQMDFSRDEIDCIKTIQNIWIEIWYEELIDIYYYYTEWFSLTPVQIDTLHEIKNIWFNISYYEIDDIKDITPEQINNLNKLRNLWISIDNNVSDLILIDEKENGILEIDSEEFYNWYEYNEFEIASHHHYKKWRIIERIEDYVQDVISEDREIWREEIIEQIRPDLITLPINEKFNIINWINKVVTKFNTVHKYLNFESWPYKTPKELLCAMRWLDEDIAQNIKENITVRQHWTWLNFFVWDPDSYQIIYDRSLTNSWLQSWWFNNPRSQIEELAWTLSVCNSVDPWENEEDYTYWTVWHEWQHNWNSYFMPDKYSETPITRAKDEITAYLRDWRWIFQIEKRDTTIEDTLTLPEEEWWLYQYAYWDDRESYKIELNKILTYANDLIGLTTETNLWLTRDNVISMLSDTPVEERENLRNNIVNAIKNHRQGESINFWRNGTETMWTMLDRINWCENIEDLKKILNDPRYSHIARQPNSKWWIEVSAIIDEITASWDKTLISYLPTEIRGKVENLLN